MNRDYTQGGDPPTIAWLPELVGALLVCQDREVFANLSHDPFDPLSNNGSRA